MATWTDIPNASLEPGAPARSVDAIALRDNAIYLKSLVSGTEAVKIPNAALSAIEDAKLSTTVTTTGRDWVLNRNATADVGAVGTYAFLHDNTASSTDLAVGSTLAGSSLAYSCVYYADVTDWRANAAGGAPSGTWRLMGYGERTASITNSRYASLWLRIS